MADEFNFLDNDQTSDEPLPEWLEEASSSDEGETDDEFDRLRERTALASEMYEEMDDTPAASNTGGFFGNLTPTQRFIVSILLLLNVVVIIVGFLVFTGRIIF